MKAVFDTKPTSIYHDDISSHYHFPRRYLSIVEKTVGDWVLLRRPRADGGNLAYFATARVIQIDSDPEQSGMSYARFSDFLKFERPVSWMIAGRYSEEALRSIPQTQVGVFLRGRSVRTLSDADFTDITAIGFSETFTRSGLTAAADAATTPPDERVKRVVQALVTRIVRDASFRAGVYEAYDHRCAVTGLRMLDSTGNSEVHAAHIVSVAEGGPDVVQNGLALSGTVHWLFDHYLISLTDDYRLLIAEEHVPAELRALMIQPGYKAFLPATPSQYPHPKYLKKHRDKFNVLHGAH